MRRKKKQSWILLLLVAAFLLWQALQPPPKPFPEVGQEAQFYATQCDDSLTPLLKAAILEAKSNIYLSIYALTDQRLIKALEKKAAEGVKVFCIDDPAMHKKHPPLKGVTCVVAPTKGLMHRKILVVDDEKIIIGSANFTPDSLEVDDNLIASLQSKHLATLIYKNVAGSILLNNSSLMHFYPLPEANVEGFQALKTLLKNARHTVYVAMFTLTHPELIEELIAAKQRGCDVVVAVDRKSAEGASQSAVHTLLQNDVAVSLSQGSHTLHHKFVYIDGNALAFGSANWTKAAFSKNEECLLILPQLQPTQIKKIEQLWHSIHAQGKLMKKAVKKSVADLKKDKIACRSDLSNDPNRLTQLLFNEEVEVLKEEGDWVYVSCLEQPHFTQERGWHFYEGYLEKSELGDPSLPPTHVVVSQASFGTLLHLPSEKTDLRPLSQPFSRELLIADAEKFLGLPYLWGGRSGLSVDCSGFIQLLYRAQGITLPRDAHPQSLRCTPLQPSQLQAGDLIYLSRKDSPEKVSHVFLCKNANLWMEAPKTGEVVRQFPPAQMQELHPTLMIKTYGSFLS